MKYFDKILLNRILNYYKKTLKNHETRAEPENKIKKAKISIILLSELKI